MLDLSARRSGEIARFLVVGGASALINTAIVVLFTEQLGLPFLLSYALCWVAVTLFGFVLNRQWSFRIKPGACRSEIVRYLAVSIFGIGLGMLFSETMIAIGLRYYIAFILATGLMTPINFIMHRNYSFSAARSQT